MKSGFYYIYILTTKSNSALYIGVTNDLKLRSLEHKNEQVRGFTSKYHVTKLVYYEVFTNILKAIKREKQLKNWHREWKLNLIKEKNQEFVELINKNGQLLKI